MSENASFRLVICIAQNKILNLYGEAAYSMTCKMKEKWVAWQHDMKHQLITSEYK